mmetsp:Transcript_82163/g.259255  ORF Transcript_82163/g.259255 Transcript_82163/m.259255 type:complete len:220 (-) Transcript_82163:153-812(-)
MVLSVASSVYSNTACSPVRTALCRPSSTTAGRSACWARAMRCSHSGPASASSMVKTIGSSLSSRAVPPMCRDVSLQALASAPSAASNDAASSSAVNGPPAGSQSRTVLAAAAASPAPTSRSRACSGIVMLPRPSPAAASVAFGTRGARSAGWSCSASAAASTTSALGLPSCTVRAHLAMRRRRRSDAVAALNIANRLPNLAHSSLLPSPTIWRSYHALC